MKHKYLLTLPALLLVTLSATFIEVQNPDPQGKPLAHPSLPATPAQNLSSDVREAWVRHYASGLIAGEDAATAVATDNAGNVYVTGSSENHPFGVDFYTMKYDAAGNQAWTAQYCAGTGLDYARAIEVDNSGNVYVTGSSDEGAGALEDFATVKYNAAGVEQWVARYNSPANLPEIPTALAIDDAGNVYVTGASGATATPDYLTVKYDASGAQQWVARYTGPVGRDNAYALAVDGSGNVYVTGTSAGSGTSTDYATIKYNASGVEQWAMRYDGPASSFEEGRALGLDASGNVYVTGRSRGTTSQADYATLKYNSSGVVQWVARYNGPGNGVDETFALAVDGSGNVYVTGGSIGAGNQVDYATVKYNDSGVEQWVARYNAAGNAEDKAVALALDGAGNVYVTGESGAVEDYATVKYNASGVEQWVARYNGPRGSYDIPAALALDGAGNVCVTGLSFGSDGSREYATVKYNASGVEQWSTRYSGPGNSDNDVYDLAVDGSGNVYVTGRSAGSDRKTVFATIKYDASGVQQWLARYKGPGSSFDTEGASAIAIDGSGNVYVTGGSVGSGTGFDYTTIKYNTSGVEQWVARYNGPGNTNESAGDIAIDGSGNVYITGEIGPNGDYLTIKYNATGVEQWVARYNGPGNALDIPEGLAVDGSGNVYVTGYSEGAGTGGYATVKYNASGSQLWVARHNGTIQTTFPTALAIDATGNVYVTGFSNSGSGQDYATVKYNSSGTQQWVASYNGSVNSGDGADDIAVDGSGNVYVTGGSGFGVGADCATIKYNASGVQQWLVRYNGPGNGDDFGTALVVDGSGNVYVTGGSTGSGTGSDFATIKYNASGVEQWVVRYDGLGNSFARALAIDNAGFVYVTGTSEGQTPPFSVYTTIKYDQTPVSVEEPRPTQPGAYWLAQNYPNPFNPSTTIRYTLAQAGQVSLKIFDLAGQEIATLVEGKQSAGEHHVQWQAEGAPSGVYFYRLQAGEKVETRKMILMR